MSWGNKPCFSASESGRMTPFFIPYLLVRIPTLGRLNIHILLFQNITLSKTLIHQQHKMYAKGLKKLLFASSTKYLKFGWDGRSVVIFVSLVSRFIPVFY
jgi:hypothetical protein